MNVELFKLNLNIITMDNIWKFFSNFGTQVILGIIIVILIMLALDQYASLKRDLYLSNKQNSDIINAVTKNKIKRNRFTK
jgi:uncharacterized membrane protein YkvI